jgi:hypothetical protein
VSTFRWYLWKEWREQRTAVLALAGMLPMLVLAITFGIKARQILVPFSGLVALVVTLLAIGGELLGSDRRAGGQWLERLPAGLSGAFPAKLVLLVLTSVLALGYGFALAALGAFLRGRPVPLALPDEACVPALVVLGAAALLVTWTFAASAWSGRGMIALLVGVLVLGGVAFVARHLFVLRYSPAALEVWAVALALVAGGLVSAWVGFVKGRRFGNALLGTAARGIPAGALCVLPVAGWSVHLLRDRTAFDFESPESHVQGAWISGDGHFALLYALRENERWDTLPSREVLVNLEDGSYETVGGPGATITAVFSKGLDEPMQEPDMVYVYGSEALEAMLVLDAFTGEVLPGESGGSIGSMPTYSRAGHGFTVREDNSYVAELIDPYHALRLRPEEIGAGRSAMDFHIGPALWLVEAWPLWLEYSPECAELSTADWMDPTADAGPMLADGRILVHLSNEERFALADPEARAIVPLSGPGTKGWPAFLQYGGLHPGEPAFMETKAGRHRLDEQLLELVPCDDSYAGQLLRWLPDGTLFFWMNDGLYRRAPSGERTCVFSFPKAEVTQ